MACDVIEHQTMTLRCQRVGWVALQQNPAKKPETESLPPHRQAPNLLVTNAAAFDLSRLFELFEGDAGDADGFCDVGPFNPPLMYSFNLNPAITPLRPTQFGEFYGQQANQFQ